MDRLWLGSGRAVGVEYVPVRRSRLIRPDRRAGAAMRAGWNGLYSRLRGEE